MDRLAGTEIPQSSRSNEGARFRPKPADLTRSGGFIRLEIILTDYGSGERPSLALRSIFELDLREVEREVVARQFAAAPVPARLIRADHHVRELDLIILLLLLAGLAHGQEGLAHVLAGGTSLHQVWARLVYVRHQ